MSSTLKSLRALADPTRLRIMALLEKEELSVNELQEITRLGQSRISTHLGLLQDSDLVRSRRDGKRTFYKLNDQADATAREFIQLAIRGAKELPQVGGTFLQAEDEIAALASVVGASFGGVRAMTATSGASASAESVADSNLTRAVSNGRSSAVASAFLLKSSNC